MGAEAKKKVEVVYPEGYLKSGYFNEDGEINADLYLKNAKLIARVLLKDDIDAKGKKINHIAVSQLRKFYEEVCNTAQDLTHKVISESKAVSEIARLDSLAGSCVSKGKATKVFYTFIHDNVEVVMKDKTMQSVQAFKEHFEAIICYFDYFAEKEQEAKLKNKTQGKMR